MKPSLANARNEGTFAKPGPSEPRLCSAVSKLIDVELIVYCQNDSLIQNTERDSLPARTWSICWGRRRVRACFKPSNTPKPTVSCGFPSCRGKVRVCCAGEERISATGAGRFDLGQGLKGP